MRSLSHPVALSSIARLTGAVVSAEQGQRDVIALATLRSAGPDDLSFLADGRYRADAGISHAAAVLVAPAHVDALRPGCIALVCDDPYLAFARVAQDFERRLREQDGEAGNVRTAIDPTSHIAHDARFGEGVVIGAGAVIESQARLANGVVIGPGVVVGARASLGAGTRIMANAVLYHDVVLGERCTIHANTVIGSDGFGYAREGQGWSKIPQLGSVRIGDRVDIGSNSSVDRGALDDTIIGSDCIIDNLVQIAHNVQIGEGCAIAGCVGIAGSARIGRRCLIGGGAGILGHLEIVDDVSVSPMSLVTRSLREPGFYSGTFPLMKNTEWERAAAVLRGLPDLRTRLRHLERMSKES